jgi:hypothetical protein
VISVVLVWAAGLAGFAPLRAQGPGLAFSEQIPTIQAGKTVPPEGG